MAEKTQLNKNLDLGGNTTVLNRQIDRSPENGSCTVLNPHIQAEGAIAPGTVLFGKYRIEERMAVAAGEADLYLCGYRNRKFVAKVYRRAASIKQEVLQQLKQLKSPYVAQVCESGDYRGICVEILPYYSRGSLQGKRFTYEQLRGHIIPCLNEGLKALHEANIIHKDLKPSNIMVTDNQNEVAIIDFGISSVTDSDNTVIITRTGMTPEYSAPETFRGVYTDRADYYSLGITLYELFCGETPYRNMSAEKIEQYLAVQRIPFPNTMPVQLQNLIRALTYYDISNRNDKGNPNRRWGYTEVKKWLDGVEQTIPGEGVEPQSIRPYFFAGKNYAARIDLLRAFAQNWEEGKKQLFRGKLADYYRIYDPTAFQICQTAEGEAARTSGKDDLIFWKTLYALEPQMKDFFWKGRRYAGLPAMGRSLLEHLRQNSSDMNDFMDTLFRERIMSQYVAMKEPEKTEMVAAVEGLETTYRASSNNSREKRVVLYLTAYMLSGQRILYLDGQEFHTLDELIGHMKRLLGENCEHLERFKQFCHKLMDHYDNLIPQFESWLIALGKQEELTRWKESLDRSR